jgi:NAD(P)-dependent dehydrogenase (short-subunit alcohol dehydrogenase family)
MKFDFSAKTVIVTGAGGGIGGATCRALHAAGANVVLVDRSPTTLAAVAGELDGAAGVLALALDVTVESDMTDMAARTLEKFGRIDGLVAAAGILRTSGQPHSVADTGFEEWRTIVDVNLTGTFLSNRAVLAAMTAQGEGDIVNISSTSGQQGRAFDGPYSASKFGIVGLSESLAEEVQRQGVRVQTVLPDAVDTPLWEQSGTAALKPQNMLSPERVANFVLYLMDMPRDVYIFNSVLKPLRSRVRRRKAKSPE